MNLTNYHSHTLYCDGRAGMEDFIRFAISRGFTSYGFFACPSAVSDSLDDGMGSYGRLSG